MSDKTEATSDARVTVRRDGVYSERTFKVTKKIDFIFRVNVFVFSKSTEKQFGKICV